MLAACLGAGLAGCGLAQSSGLPTSTLAALQVTSTPEPPASDSSPEPSDASPVGPPVTSEAPLIPAPAQSAPPPAEQPPPPAGAARAGNPVGAAVVSGEGEAADTSDPTTVIGDGSPAGCTSAAVVAAVARGGVITFSCGPSPITIIMDTTAKVVNTAARVVTIDGGGLVTLSGSRDQRILYMNTCDEAQGWTTSRCNDQDHPHLTVQNISLVDGNSTGITTDGGGGGAIFARGGRLKVVNTTFIGNRCDPTGPDLGGGAIRALDQSQDLPVYVVSSTFRSGTCSNGGGISSIGVSWVILNSVFTGNRAVGSGANPAKPGTPGGGSGGAIYADGNRFTITLSGTLIEDNQAVEGGGAVFFVSNDLTGTLSIQASTLRSNPSEGFETDGYPGIFFLGADIVTS